MVGDKAISFQALISQQQAAGFVGREGALAQFRANLAVPIGDPARRLVFFIHGDGGVGKTSLVMRLREISADHGAVTAYLDESVFTVPDAMHAIAVELGRQGQPMKRFTRLFKTYRQRRLEVETDHNAPPGTATFLTSTAVKLGLHAAKGIPGVGGLVEVVDAAALAEQAEQFRKFLGTKFRSHQDVLMLLSPVQALTPAFVEDIAEAGKHKPLTLFFDTYERTSSILDEWLIGLLAGTYGALPPNLVITIAGRAPVDITQWAHYLDVVADTPLAPFTEVEAHQFLAVHRITDPSLVEVMLGVSGRLPLLLAILAQNRPHDPAQLGDPSGDAVERFLKWETDEHRRALAVVAALPRFVDEDVLSVLVDEGANSRELFAWLRAQPFTSHLAGRCHYHDVVRAAMIRVARGQSPTHWREIHGHLAEQHRAWRLVISEQDAWGNPEWQAHWIEEIYHRLCIDADGSLPDALRTLVQASSESEALRGQWVEMLTQAGIDAKAAPLQQWGEQLETALLADEAEVEFYNLLAGAAAIPTAARAEVLRLRGRVHRSVGRYAIALADYNQAIGLCDNFAFAFAGRGETYRLMGRYDDALADFDRAIELDPRDAWTIVSRGETRQLMGRYDDALADFTRSFELDPSYARAIADRGETLQLLERFDDALADFDRAIGLDPDYTWAIASRGRTYQLMGRYAEALADFDRAIGLDPDWPWAIASRGRTYRLLGRYAEALADFDRAIELAPDYPWNIVSRGETCWFTGRYDDALADFDRAIELDPDYVAAVLGRGRTYYFMGRYNDALVDFSRAIEIAPEYVAAMTARAETYRFMGRYDDALAELTHVIELVPDYDRALAARGEIYRMTGRFDDALVDFDRAIELDSDYIRAIVGRGEIYRLIDRCDDALADFDRAIELVPDYVEAIVGRGETYRFMGRYDDALAELTRAVGLAPDFPWAIESRGQTSLAMGLGQDALPDLTRAIELVPGYTRAIASRGEIYRLMGRYEDALVELTRATELAPDYYWVIVTRGEVYQLMGRFDDALADFERAIELVPGDRRAIAGRDEIYQLTRRYDASSEGCPINDGSDSGSS